MPNAPRLKISVYYNTTVKDYDDHRNMILTDGYIKHPQYNGKTQDSDIALLHLSSPIPFDKNIGPECLPWSLTNQDFHGAKVTASGFGTTEPVRADEINNGYSSDIMLKVTLPVLTTTECRKYLTEKTITNNMFCTYAEGKDTCQVSQTNNFLHIWRLRWLNAKAAEENLCIYIDGFGWCSIGRFRWSHRLLESSQWKILGSWCY